MLLQFICFLTIFKNQINDYIGLAVLIGLWYP
jgi:hypothetical protein